MTVLGHLLNAAPGARPQGLTAWGDWSGQGKATWAGQDVSAEAALRHLTVYGCVRFISDGISTLPVDVFRRRADGSPEQLRTPPIIESPTADLDFTSWAGQVLSSLLLPGNAYLFMDYRAGSLAQIIPLDPTKAQVERRDGRKVTVIDGEVFTSLQVRHIPGVMWPGSDEGMSPLEAARQTIGQGMSAQEYGARFFGQGAMPSGVIEYPHELDPDRATQMAKNWARDHSSPSKSGLPGVLDNGAVWKASGVTNEQSQFLETRKFTASEIAAQMFLIDPSEMGLPVDGSSLTYANLEQRNARKVQVTFLPWITRIEKFLSSLLPRPQYVKLNVSGLLRGDTKTRFQAYRTGIASKFMVPNEAREFEDWAPLPGGDEVVEGGMADAPTIPGDETE